MYKLPLLTRALAVFALALWPVAALALPPPHIEEVQAAYENGTVKVTWEAPAEQGIARYRIYYSHASILQNGGTYDDFATTDDAGTEYVLRDLPAVESLYVAVIAVGEDGEEGTVFGSEAFVEIPAGAPAAQEPPTAAASLQLLSAQSASQTGVLLTFSRAVTVGQQDAATAFRIVDGSGALLLISRIYLQGPAILLVTEPQAPDTVYSVSVTQVWSADGGAPVPVDPRTSVARFSALPAGAASPSLPVPQGGTPTVANVQLRIDGRRQNAYDVLVTFEIPAGAESVSSIEVFQSTDRGNTFGAPQVIPAEARSVRFESVPAGIFTVMVRAKTAAGLASPGIPASIAVGGTGWTGTAPLSGSGAGLAAVVTLTGAMLGWRRMKRK
ncbi:MAG: fibronectin type III domain-containing protein [Candidatus Peribacteraceae bacterium]|jgi:hypothetical protein